MANDHKLLWKPKLKELPEQCASCPFKYDNEAEFKAVVQRLNASAGMVRKVTSATTAHARMMIRIQTAKAGDFACHCTVYDADMHPKDCDEYRQCPGATAFYREQHGGKEK